MTKEQLRIYKRLWTRRKRAGEPTNPHKFVTILGVKVQWKVLP